MVCCYDSSWLSCFANIVGHSRECDKSYLVSYIYQVYLEYNACKTQMLGLSDR